MSKRLLHEGSVWERKDGRWVAAIRIGASRSSAMGSRGRKLWRSSTRSVDSPVMHGQRQTELPPERVLRAPRQREGR